MASKSKKNDELPMRAIMIWSTVLAVLLTFFVLLLLFRVKRVEVTGNCHYTDKTIEHAVMGGPLTSNTLFLNMFRKHPSHTGADFIEDISVEYVNRHTVHIRVTETKPVGMVFMNNTNYYFDENGVITVISAIGEIYDDVDEKCDDGQARDIFIIPLVEGLKIEDPELGVQIPTGNSHLFEMLKSISGMINKNNIFPDKLILEDEETVTMICGDITVLLGRDDHMEEKIEELSGILPAAVGLKGVLHLEKFDGTQTRIIFDQAKEEEAPEEEDPLAAALAIAEANDAAKAAGASVGNDGDESYEDEGGEDDYSDEASEEGADAGNADAEGGEEGDAEGENAGNEAEEAPQDMPQDDDM